MVYSQADIDDPGFGVGDLDADLIGISGSVAITDELFIQAGYAKTDFDDVFGISLEADDIFLGIGWHRALTENTDFVFDANYLFVAMASFPSTCNFVAAIDINQIGYFFAETAFTVVSWRD